MAGRGETWAHVVLDENQILARALRAPATHEQTCPIILHFLNPNINLEMATCLVTVIRHVGMQNPGLAEYCNCKCQSQLASHCAAQLQEGSWLRRLQRAEAEHPRLTMRSTVNGIQLAAAAPWRERGG
jgi:hypothetical protein